MAGDIGWKPRSIEYSRESVKLNLDTTKNPDGKAYEIQNGDTYYNLAQAYQKESGSKKDINSLIQQMEQQTGQDAQHLGIGTKIDFSKLDDTQAPQADQQETKADDASGKRSPFTGNAKKDGENYVSLDNSPAEEATAGNSTESEAEADSPKATKAVYTRGANRGGIVTTRGENGARGAAVASGGNYAAATTDADGNAEIAAENERGETADGSITDKGVTFQAAANKGAASGSVTSDGKTVKIHGETRDGNGAGATVTENGVDQESQFDGQRQTLFRRKGYTTTTTYDPNNQYKEITVDQFGGALRGERVTVGSGYDKIAQNKKIMAQIAAQSQGKQDNWIKTVDADDLQTLRAASADREDNPWQDISDADIQDFINTSASRNKDYTTTDSDHLLSWLFGRGVSADDLKMTREEYGQQ
jgi:hypothetical protein